MSDIFRTPGRILLHPGTISLLLTVVISVSFLPRYGKYNAELARREQNYPATDIFTYEDLDHNGYSDVIRTANYTNGTNCITAFFEPDVFFQEWDLPGHFRFARPNYLIIGDYDGNSTREMYIFTFSNDSVLLHCISDIFNKKPVFRTQFITEVATINDSAHVEIVPGEMEDLNGDDYKELIFAVNAGFSLYPRSVFAYDIKNNSLARSPESGYFSGNLRQADVNGDGIREIIINGYATTNFVHKKVAYTDEHCWLMVLDKNLQFLFPPVPFSDSGYSGLSVMPVLNKKGYSDLYGFYLPPLLTKKSACLYKFANSGESIRKKEIPGYKFFKTTFIGMVKSKRRPLIGLLDNEGNGVFYDTSFKLVKEFTVPFSYMACEYLDIDGDGTIESIIVDNVRSMLGIYHDDLRDLVSVPLDLDGGTFKLSVKKAAGQQSLLAVINGGNVFLISYEKNPMYYLQWIVYAGVFAAILMFIYLIRMLTRNQMKKRYETVQKINRLQLMVVRNQIDPHFTLNAINSVIGAIQREERDAATQSLVHFSRMYRALVLSGDQTDRTLEEEIDFVGNYLELERFRFGNKFEYQIDIGPEVNMKWKVPKMIIQTPVENAVKHGLLPKQEKGHLKISVSQIDNYMNIEVEDNGVGRTASAKQNAESTGMGLKIMDEFLTLYKSIQNVQIDWKIIDLVSPSGESRGTKVVTRIHKGKPEV